MKTQLAAIMAVGFIVAGCHNPVNSVENAQKTSQRNMIADQRVVNDTGLGKSVSVVGVNTTMTPGGFLQAQVELLNRTKSLHRFSYRFEWFDQNGMQVNSTLSAVIADQIEGGESKFISAVAPTMECKDFRLKLLEAH